MTSRKLSRFLARKNKRLAVVLGVVAWKRLESWGFTCWDEM